jgi:hypothetical protein|tara:strand:+ start:112 stop:222 length:111 start_codon:yes stop_codon:yes gene_type:complete
LLELYGLLWLIQLDLKKAKDKDIPEAGQLAATHQAG